MERKYFSHFFSTSYDRNFKWMKLHLFFFRTELICHIAALECKPANSQQGNFKGQRKKQTKFNLVVMERNYFSHFFLQLRS